MAAKKYPGPLGCDTNQPIIDGGTNCLNESNQPGPVQQGYIGPSISAVPVSPLEKALNSAVDWGAELNEAIGMGVWWLIGSPSLGLPNGGDLVFGPGDKETEHMRSTPAYQEAVKIYQSWLNNGQPSGKVEIEGAECEFVPSKGYFYVKGRTGKNRDGGWNTEPLRYPLWGFTGNFAIRFTETGYPKEGYVSVEIENFTSLPSYFHGVAPKNPILENLYTKRSGVPFLSRSRQVYRFNTYIPRNPVATQVQGSGTEIKHQVVSGDTLSALSKVYYGDMNLWPIIFTKNQSTIGVDPDRLVVGQTLVIPAKEKLTPEQINQAKVMAQSRARRHPVKVEPLR